MNKEIKEILDFLKDKRSYYKTLQQDKTDKLLDYITNLQEENEKLKEVINDDMTVYLKGLEDGKEKMKQCLKVFTNKEIKRLNNIINECAEDILKELEENHHLSYGVALGIRQKLLDYRELKGE